MSDQQTAPDNATLTCSRCSRRIEPMPRAPLPGATGEEVHQKVCADCWAEWQRVEVMVINELRLNFMDPDAQSTLERHMREFLALPSPDA